MKTLKYTHISLAVIVTLIVSGCVVTQKPVPVVDGSSDGGNYSGTEPQSSAEPYNPDSRGYVPPAASSTYATPPSGGVYVPSYAPVDINARQHTVVRGDTVYNISKRYNISQDDLRQWNNIVENIISVGQVLYVKDPGENYSVSMTKISQPQVTVAKSPTNSSPGSVSTSGQRMVDGVSWVKPAHGQLVTKFSPVNKGIEITGLSGSPIVAAASGKVIYSSTLDGYGNLIIIQHNTKYLTAYGNNQSNLVKEGDTVRQGQKIATMGKTGASRVQLHFELRKDGQAVDPLIYIPVY
ncbi:MAG: peptidoglycan DD-metalloendopeptidase family protein [Neisseriaceae bacterium]|nr:MAG: peptidoglycan DD-metalloendopeptidase family protein [Neisseriaceae bacterium]